MALSQAPGHGSPLQRILVVEDNAITRKMMRVALESAGYGVLEAPDGKTAVHLAKQESPSLVLQDILLPDFDGLDLVRELRKSIRDVQVPILACTGLMSMVDEARTIEGGFNDYLFKPVEPSRLLEVVGRYLAIPAQAKKEKIKIKVLLVDNDPIEIKLQKMILEANGFAVTTANDGQTALEIAQRSRPDAVLSDLIMPRMNGFDLCLALRRDAKLASLPIVIASSTSPSIGADDRKLATKVGADAFVGRTPDLKEVLKELRAALGRRTHPKPARDSGTLTSDYIQRIVGQLEQQTSRRSDLIRRAAEEKAQLAVIASITETLNRKLPLRAALDEALARILDAAGISMGAIYLVDPSGKLTLESQIGWGPSQLDELNNFFGHSAILYRTLGEAKAFKMPSAEITPNVTRHLQDKIHCRSFLIAPLVVVDEPQGVLAAFSSRAELGDEWVNSVRTVSVQLAQSVLLARTLARVSESEQRFRELAENIREIFFVAGPDGHPIHYVSPAYEQITGRRSEDLYRDSRLWRANIHPEDRTRVEQAIQSDPQNFDQQYRIVKPGGETRWLRDRTFPVCDEAGKVVRTVGIAEDITARKRAEEKAQQNLERVRALHEINVALASTLDLKAILNVLLQKIDLFLPYDAATIRLYDAKTGRLELVASRNIDEEEWNRHLSGPEHGQHYTRIVFESLKPLAVRNMERDARSAHGGFLFKQGLISFLGAPLIAKETALGVLTLYGKQERDFTQDEVALLSTIAGQAAVAIQNSQLYEKIDLSRKELELANRSLERSIKQLSGFYTALTPLSPSETIQEMMEGILDRVKEATGADAGLIRVRNPKNGTYPFTGHRGFPDYYLAQVETAPTGGAVDWVIKHGKPIIAGDIAAEPRLKGKLQLQIGLRSCAMLPLKVHDEVRGLIHLASRTPNYFEEEQQEHLMAIARQMGVALENRELFDSLKASRDQLEKANKVKDEFLSVMSHELRTPLSVVMGYTGLVKDGNLGAVNEPQQHALQKVLNRAGDQLEMINEIMQTTQLEANAISATNEVVDLRDLLDHLRSDYEVRADKKDVRLLWHYPRTAMPSITDGGKLRQILQNLINNALKFTEKGTIAISARLIADKADKKVAEFQVTDTGIGIAKENQAMIFLKFQQLDSSETRLFGGVGLGLYIVKNFTELLGGKINVESEVGKGSTFTVTVPIRSATPPGA